MANFCVKCGSSLFQGATFCTKCGAKVVDVISRKSSEVDIANQVHTSNAQQSSLEKNATDDKSNALDTLVLSNTSKIVKSEKSEKDDTVTNKVIDEGHNTPTSKEQNSSINNVDVKEMIFTCHGYYSFFHLLDTFWFGKFSGRCCVLELWLTFLCLLIAFFLPMSLLSGGAYYWATTQQVTPQTIMIGTYIIIAVISIIMFIPGVKLTFRRLHDLNMSGWRIIIAFIPFVGQIFALYLALRPGMVGCNYYGPEPGFVVRS